MNYLKSLYKWFTITDEDAERAQNSLYLDVNTGIFADINDTSNNIVLQIIYNNKNENNIRCENMNMIDDIRFFKNGNFEFRIFTNSPYFPSWINLNSDIKIKGNIKNYIPEKTYLDTIEIINHIQSIYLPPTYKSSSNIPFLIDHNNIDYLYINGSLYIETIHYKNMSDDKWKCIDYLQKMVPLIVSNYYKSPINLIQMVR